ncbi:MAG: hypothetical protein MHM6MM_003850 [Cercozoa sp. M6MM]
MFKVAGQETDGLSKDTQTVLEVLSQSHSLFATRTALSRVGTLAKKATQSRKEGVKEHYKFEVAPADRLEFARHSFESELLQSRQAAKDTETNEEEEELRQRLIDVVVDQRLSESDEELNQREALLAVTASTLADAVVDFQSTLAQRAATIRSSAVASANQQQNQKNKALSPAGSLAFSMGIQTILFLLEGKDIAPLLDRLSTVLQQSGTICSLAGLDDGVDKLMEPVVSLLVSHVVNTQTVPKLRSSCLVALYNWALLRGSLPLVLEITEVLLNPGNKETLEAVTILGSEVMHSDDVDVKESLNALEFVSVILSEVCKREDMAQQGSSDAILQKELAFAVMPPKGEPEKGVVHRVFVLLKQALAHLPQNDMEAKIVKNLWKIWSSHIEMLSKSRMTLDTIKSDQYCSMYRGLLDMVMKDEFAQRSTDSKFLQAEAGKLLSNTYSVFLPTRLLQLEALLRTPSSSAAATMYESLSTSFMTLDTVCEMLEEVSKSNDMAAEFVRLRATQNALVDLVFNGKNVPDWAKTTLQALCTGLCSSVQSQASTLRYSLAGQESLATHVVSLLQSLLEKTMDAVVASAEKNSTSIVLTLAEHIVICCAASAKKHALPVHVTALQAIPVLIDRLGEGERSQQLLTASTRLVRACCGGYDVDRASTAFMRNHETLMLPLLDPTVHHQNPLLLGGAVANTKPTPGEGDKLLQALLQAGPDSVVQAAIDAMEQQTRAPMHYFIFPTLKEQAMRLVKSVFAALCHVEGVATHVCDLMMVGDADEMTVDIWRRAKECIPTLRQAKTSGADVQSYINNVEARVSYLLSTVPQVPPNLAPEAASTPTAGAEKDELDQKEQEEDEPDMNMPPSLMRQPSTLANFDAAEKSGLLRDGTVAGSVSEDVVDVPQGEASNLTKFVVQSEDDLGSDLNRLIAGACLLSASLTAKTEALKVARLLRRLCVDVSAGHARRLDAALVEVPNLLKVPSCCERSTCASQLVDSFVDYVRACHVDAKPTSTSIALVAHIADVSEQDGFVQWLRSLHVRETVLSLVSPRPSEKAPFFTRFSAWQLWRLLCRAGSRASKNSTSGTDFAKWQLEIMTSLFEQTEEESAETESVASLVSSQPDAAVAAATETEEGEEFEVEEFKPSNEDFGTTGILYHLATLDDEYKNPADAGLVTVTASSLGDRVESLNPLVGRKTARVVTKSESDAWLQVEFEKHTVQLQGFSFMHYSSFASERIKNFEIRAKQVGSEDTWVVLSQHKDDDRLAAQTGSTATYKLQQPEGISESEWQDNLSKFYSAFRVSQIGKNSSGHSFLALSCVELYGGLRAKPTEVAKSAESAVEPSVWEERKTSASLSELPNGWFKYDAEDSQVSLSFGAPGSDDVSPYQGKPGGNIDAFTTRDYCFRYQGIYLPSEINEADPMVESSEDAPEIRVVTTVSFFPTAAPGRDMVCFRVALGETDSETLSSFDNDVQVVFGPVEVPQSAVVMGKPYKVTLSQPFVWNTSRNLVVDVSNAGSGYTSGGNLRGFNTTAGRGFRGRCDTHYTMFPFNPDNGSACQEIPVVSFGFEQKPVAVVEEMQPSGPLSLAERDIFQRQLFCEFGNALRSSSHIRRMTVASKQLMSRLLRLVQETEVPYPRPLAYRMLGTLLNHIEPKEFDNLQLGLTWQDFLHVLLSRVSQAVLPKSDVSYETMLSQSKEASCAVSALRAWISAPKWNELLFRKVLKEALEQMDGPELQSALALLGSFSERLQVGGLVDFRPKPNMAPQRGLLVSLEDNYKPGTTPQLSQSDVEYPALDRKETVEAFITNDYSFRYTSLYLASELKDAGVSGPGMIKSVSFFCEQASGRDMSALRIALGTTSQDQLTGFPSDLTVCYGPKHISNTHMQLQSFTTFELETPFYYDGRSNLIIDTSNSNTGYSSGGRAAGVNVGTNRAWRARTDTHYTAFPFEPGSGTSDPRVLCMRLTFEESADFVAGILPQAEGAEDLVESRNPSQVASVPFCSSAVLSPEQAKEVAVLLVERLAKCVSHIDEKSDARGVYSARQQALARRVLDCLAALLERKDVNLRDLSNREDALRCLSVLATRPLKVVNQDVLPIYETIRSRIAQMDLRAPLETLPDEVVARAVATREGLRTGKLVAPESPCVAADEAVQDKQEEQKEDEKDEELLSFAPNYPFGGQDFLASPACSGNAVLVECAGTVTDGSSPMSLLSDSKQPPRVFAVEPNDEVSQPSIQWTLRKHQIRPTLYSLRHWTQNDECLLRNWSLEAALGPDGDWTTIASHTTDESLLFAGQPFSFPVEIPDDSDENPRFFDRFRLSITGHNSSGNFTLALSGFEVYGTVKKQPAQPELAIVEPPTASATAVSPPSLTLVPSVKFVTPEDTSEDEPSGLFGGVFANEDKSKAMWCMSDVVGVEEVLLDKAMEEETPTTVNKACLLKDHVVRALDEAPFVMEALPQKEQLVIGSCGLVQGQVRIVSTKSTDEPLEGVATQARLLVPSTWKCPDEALLLSADGLRLDVIKQEDAPCLRLTLDGCGHRTSPSLVVSEATLTVSVLKEKSAEKAKVAVFIDEQRAISWSELPHGVVPRELTWHTVPGQTRMSHVAAWPCALVDSDVKAATASVDVYETEFRDYMRAPRETYVSETAESAVRKLRLSSVARVEADAIDTMKISDTAFAPTLKGASLHVRSADLGEVIQVFFRVSGDGDVGSIRVHGDQKYDVPLNETLLLNVSSTFGRTVAECKRADGQIFVHNMSVDSDEVKELTLLPEVDDVTVVLLACGLGVAVATPPSEGPIHGADCRLSDASRTAVATLKVNDHLRFVETSLSAKEIPLSLYVKGQKLSACDFQTVKSALATDAASMTARRLRVYVQQLVARVVGKAAFMGVVSAVEAALTKYIDTTSEPSAPAAARFVFEELLVQGSILSKSNELFGSMHPALVADTAAGASGSAGKSQELPDHPTIEAFVAVQGGKSLDEADTPTLAQVPLIRSEQRSQSLLAGTVSSSDMRRWWTQDKAQVLEDFAEAVAERKLALDECATTVLAEELLLSQHHTHAAKSISVDAMHQLFENYVLRSGSGTSAAPALFEDIVRSESAQLRSALLQRVHGEILASCASLCALSDEMLPHDWSAWLFVDVGVKKVKERIEAARSQFSSVSPPLVDGEEIEALKERSAGLRTWYGQRAYDSDGDNNNESIQAASALCLQQRVQCCIELLATLAESVGLLASDIPASVINSAFALALSQSDQYKASVSEAVLRLVLRLLDAVPDLQFDREKVLVMCSQAVQEVCRSRDGFNARMAHLCASVFYTLLPEDTEAAVRGDESEVVAALRCLRLKCCFTSTMKVHAFNDAALGMGRAEDIDTLSAEDKCAEFDRLSEVFTKEMDGALVLALGEDAKQEVLKLPSQKDLERYHLAHIDKNALLLRVAALSLLNETLKTLLTSGVLDLSADDVLARRFLSLRGMMRTGIKQTILQTGLRRTGVLQPPKPNLKLDRFRASTLLQGPRALVDWRCTRTMVAQAARAFKSVSAAMWRVMPGASERPFKVFFIGLHSDDHGGPYREALSSMVDELTGDKISAPLFMKCPNFYANVGGFRSSCIPRRAAKTEAQIDCYAFVGQLIGLALRAREFLALDLAPLVWKHLCGEKLGRQDIQMTAQHAFAEVDSIRRAVQDCDAEGGTQQEKDARLLQRVAAVRGDEYLYWTTPASDGTEQPLCDGGETTRVTADQLRDGSFCDAIESFRCNEFNTQLEAIRRGLGTVVPLASLSLFSWRELERMVCGRRSMNIDLLQQMTSYDGCDRDTPAVRIFWDCLRNRMNDEERAKWLRFVWGRERLPAEAAHFSRNFKISFRGHQGDSHLPVSHTCFFSIELPNYTSVEVCYQKLVYAATHCVGIDTDGSVVPTDTAMQERLELAENEAEEEDLFVDEEPQVQMRVPTPAADSAADDLRASLASSLNSAPPIQSQTHMPPRVMQAAPVTVSGLFEGGEEPQVQRRIDEVD